MKKFVKGMNKDAERVDQPKGTYRDALNANINDVKGAVTNEQGTSRVSAAELKIVGQTTLDDNSLVVFGIDTITNISVIAVINPFDNTSQALLSFPSLNFSIDKTIDATFKVSAEGDRLVYFTDNTYTESNEEAYTYVLNNNPPRVINIDRQLRATQENNINFFRVYGNPDFGVDKLDVIQNVGVTARIDGVEITDGGGLITGAYLLGLAYLDEDFNETDFFVLSNPVSIVTASEESIPIESMIGDQRGTQSNKSIVWKVRVFKDCNYKYIQPAIIKLEGQSEGIVARDAKKLSPIQLYNEDAIIDVVHTGIEQSTLASIEDITVTNPKYLAAKTIAQSNNRLYMANLKSRPDIGYQKFANSIEVNAEKEQVDEFDNRVFDTIGLNTGYALMINPNFNDGENYGTGGSTGGYNYDYINEVMRPVQGDSPRGYRNANRLFKKKSFRRGDVYALYISFILNDGTETMAYHIPGRAPTRIGYGNTPPISNFILETAALADYETTSGAYVGMSTTEILSIVPSAKTYQIFDTSILNTVDTTNMAFWENENETYPNTEDFDIWTVAADGTPEQTTDSLRNKKVRHHKFPSNKNNDFGYMPTSQNFSIPNNYSDSNPSDGKRVIFNESVRLLGFKLKNIRIPRDILNQVQEYRVYYAKRNEQDKLVVGSGVPVPGHPRYSTQITTGKDTSLKLPSFPAFYMKGEPASKVSASSVLNIQNPKWSETVDSYYGSSVFKIHDFSMLRQEKNISNLTHIEVQYIMSCRHFKGGPGLIRSESEDEGYEVGWLSADLGNTADPNDDDMKVKAFQTSLMFANRYFPVTNGQADVGAHLGSGPHIRAQDILPKQAIFALQPDSKAYLPGLTRLKDDTSSGFSSANYLLNNIGETAIALGLVSGLPTLSGFHPSGVDESLFNAGNLPIEDIDYGASKLFWHGGNQGYLNIYESANNLRDAANYVLEDNGAYIHGKPNVYLVNMCSHKSNVYKPFDRQTLVWTGHSQKILNPNLESGDVSPDAVGYEIAETSLSDDFNYYTGATSTPVFGGDTFICRFSVRTTSMEYGHTFFRNATSGAPATIPSDLAQFSPNLGAYAGVQVSSPTGVPPEGYGALVDLLNNIGNRSNQNSTPVSTLMSYICESDDNINFRHSFDVEKGIEASKAMFFDYNIAKSVIFVPPTTDLTFRDNLLYLAHYSALQDLRAPIIYPKNSKVLSKFPTRTIRSTVSSNTLYDGYRKFLPIDKKDIPQDTGEITKLVERQSILYLSTEKSLFMTKGQEQFDIGANSVFIGSGNIFAIDPDKAMDADIGIGGTRSQFAAIRVPEGYFFVSSEEKKVYLLGQSLEPVSIYGMEDWFLENIPFTLEDYGLNPYAPYTSLNLDAPTDKFGFVAAYDSNYKRILLTKNEINPTDLFISLYNSGYIEINNTTGLYQYTSTVPANYLILYGKSDYSNPNLFKKGGWTVSYFPSIKVWISRHSYVPKLYSFTNVDYYSYNDNKIWAHNDFSNPGNFYETIYNFEFEYINNDSSASSKIYSAFRYIADVTQTESHTNQHEKFTYTGFTSFYVYNTHQISGAPTTLNYLTNIRRADKMWYVNDFRDMSLQEISTNSNLVTGVANVQDNFTTGVTVPAESQKMFTEEGVVNANYIDSNKQWYDQKRFVDNFIGVRLIASNESKKLINLYSAGTKYRQSFR